MKRKKVCFLAVALNAGGLETYLLRFLRLYCPKILTTVMLKDGSTADDLYNDYIAAGANVVLLRMGYFNVKSWIRLYKFFRKEKVETVCDMGANFAGIPVTIARLAGVKKRIAVYRQSSHQFQVTKINLIYADFVNWLVYKNATAILANSQHALNFYFGKKIDGRCKVVKNGVNREIFDIKESKEELRTCFGLPADKIIVGHTGRVVLAKNHTTILNVASKVCAHNRHVVFVLAGRGTLDLPVRDGVILLGYCSEIPKLLKTFDLFYFPSITESQPNALIEAIMSGLPFVASDIEPIKECIPANYYSQLVPATDVEASAEMIQKIINKRNKNQYCCQEWATNEYDADRNFNLFYSELI